MMEFTHKQLFLFVIGFFGLVGYFSVKFIQYLDKPEWTLSSISGVVLLALSGVSLFFWIIEFLFFPFCGQWEVWGQIKQAPDLVVPIIAAFLTSMVSLKMLKS